MIENFTTIAIQMNSGVIFRKTWRALQTRHKAENAKKSGISAKYGKKARTVLNALLEKYQYGSIISMEYMGNLQINPLAEMGSSLEIVGLFGEREQFQVAVCALQNQLYKEIA